MYIIIILFYNYYPTNLVCNSVRVCIYLCSMFECVYVRMYMCVCAVYVHVCVCVCCEKKS